nr:TPM domain-containing protein [Ancylobacter lacus]
MAPALAALTFPPLTGRVVDAADIIDATVQAGLEQRLAALEKASGDQLVVATVPSLQGTSVEDYANRLFRAWRLGQKSANNGVLLLVAPNERRVRIEVGYGLEGIVTDAVSSTIIQTAIVPAFRKGDVSGGIVKGTDALVEILSLDREEARRRAQAVPASPMAADDWGNLVFLLVLVAFGLFVFYRARSGRGLRRAGRGAALPGGITSWDWSRGGGSRGGWSGSGGGGFSGGGGSSGGGGASGSW